MTHRSSRPGPHRRIALATLTSLAVAGLAGQAAYAGSDAPSHRTTTSPTARMTRGWDGVVLDLGPKTGTVRFLADLDGFLTDPSSDSPRDIALDYVRANVRTLGLTIADLATFHVERDYRDIEGTHHLYFTQHLAGRSAGRHGLTAAVDEHGRLLMLGGTPVTGGRPAKRSPATSATRPDEADARPATRHSRSAGQGDSIGLVYRYFPDAPHGGKASRVDFTARHWLSAHATTLSGNNAYAFSDVDADGHASREEEVHPRNDHSFIFRLQPFHPPVAQSFCGKPWPCSWNPDRPWSWETNRAQNATQVFFYVNKWHDYLAKAPIGFTEAAGNFQVRNHTGQGKGGDPVEVRTDDGAATGTGRLRGLPDEDHVDDAEMSTPPDGQSPTMQMYLQHRPFTSYPKGNPFAPNNIGDEADTVYHEYTHGLSGRLVVDVHGREAIGPDQGGAMGEGWSDWYAMDYLVARGLVEDRHDRADVANSPYDGAAVTEVRTEPMDCTVGDRDSRCTGGHTGHRGGYTYADYGQIIGKPEVHADGEIWGQTLWDLRDRLGSRRAESLVTRAMELAPYDPSFLDMRNAMLVADNAVYGGADRTAIWTVFAHRGMGFYARSHGNDDVNPQASFAMPPD